MHINLHFIVEGLIFIGTLFKVFRNKQKWGPKTSDWGNFPFGPAHLCYIHIYNT